MPWLQFPDLVEGSLNWSGPQPLQTKIWFDKIDLQYIWTNMNNMNFGICLSWSSFASIFSSLILFCSIVVEGGVFGVGVGGVSSTISDISICFKPSDNLSVHPNECEAQWGIHPPRHDGIRSRTSWLRAKMTQLKLSHGFCNNWLSILNINIAINHTTLQEPEPYPFEHVSLVNRDNLNIKLMVECMISHLGVVISWFLKQEMS